jgi:hypothetical protein
MESFEVLVRIQYKNEKALQQMICALIEDLNIGYCELGKAEAQVLSVQLMEKHNET